MKTIYILYKKVDQCYGHGDYGREDMIVRTGPYGSGEFPPAFLTREDAEKYLNELPDKDKWLRSQLKIGTMILMDDPK